MEHNLKKTARIIRETNLSHAEKGAIFARLSAYQEANPARAGLVKTPFFPALSSFFTIKSAYALVATLLLVATGTVAYAAEGSLPGETLYAVKVKVNEPLRGALSFSAGSKAEWETKKLERRLEEAEELAREGKLDGKSLAEMEKRIDKNFEDHDSWKEKDKQDKENARAVVPATLLPQQSESVADIDEKAQEHRPILEDIKSKGSDDQRENIEKLERKLDERSRRDTKGRDDDDELEASGKDKKDR